MKLDPRELRHISLKWKLLIPFLFLPAALTLLLVAWGIGSQNRILTDQEHERMTQNYISFQQRLKVSLNQAMIMAELTALNPLVQQALAQRDREWLAELYLPVYRQLQKLPGLKQFHFHEYPGRSFLRLHSPGLYGDDLSGYRMTINRAYETGTTAVGLEFGLTGWSLRGVAPIYHQGRLVGSVEVGSELGRPFLEQLKKDFGCDLSIYRPFGQSFTVLASTSPNRVLLVHQAYGQALEKGRTIFQTIERRPNDLAVLTAPLKNYKGDIVAVLELTKDRSGTLLLIRKHTILILTYGGAVLALALVFVWWVSTLFLAPIRTLVDQARKITAGDKAQKINIPVRDEFGTLADALNQMLTKLEESRRSLKNHALDLEHRVRERTEELVKSEEKFRNLVEHIPIVVYRLEKGMVRSFVSSHIEKLTGWPAEDLVGGQMVWSGAIHPDDLAAVIREKRRCLTRGLTFDMEYRLRDRWGQVVEVVDHAEPIPDRTGQGYYLEGFMLDLRERKRLEEQTLQAEELKSLSEISSRLAHEFRNPLSALGLAARRLGKSLEPGSKEERYARILVEEVARLERILTMIQTYIQPVDLSFHEVPALPWLEECLRRTEPCIRTHEIEVILEAEDELPNLRLDEEHMTRALVNILRNAAFQMPPKGVLNFSARTADCGLVELKLVYPAGYLTDDRLRHFFYPFTTEDADSSLVDLPMAPVVVHRHGGMINVGRQGDDLVSVSITLPALTEKRCDDPD